MKVRGVLVYHSKSTKIQLYNSCVNLLGVFIWQEYWEALGGKRDVS